MRSRIPLLVCAFVLFAGKLNAQYLAVTGTTETPEPGSGHDYLQALNETVDPRTGSLSIRIAAPAPHERGVNMPVYGFTYDTASLPLAQPEPLWVNCAETSPQNPNPTALPCEAINSIGLSDVGTFEGEIDGIGPYPSAPNSLSWMQNDVMPPQGNTTGAAAYANSYCLYLTGFVYTDPEGGNHNLDIQLLQSQTYPPGSCNGANIFQYQQGGDAHYRATASVNTDGPEPTVIYVADSHGDVLFPVVEDTNGNGGNGLQFTPCPTACDAQETTSYSNGLSGTGRTYAIAQNNSGNQVVTVTGLAQPFTTSYYLNVPVTTKLNFTNLSTNMDDLNCGNTYTATEANAESIAVPKAVTLPNGLQYAFNYDPTFAFINHITYPTGSTVDYTWSYIPQSQWVVYTTTGVQGLISYTATCSYNYDWMGITKRVVSFDGIHPAQEQDFQYSTSPGTNGLVWAQKVTTVTTKDLLRPGTPSYNTVYTYLPGPLEQQVYAPDVQTPEATVLEHTIQYYDTTGSLLKTVTKTWVTNDLLAGECVTLPNGSTSGVFYQYLPSPGLNGVGLRDSGYLTDVKTDIAEYDYGQGVTSACQQPSSTPTRETVTAYHTFPSTPVFPGGSYILDRPDSVKQYGNGTLLAETDYIYDGTPVVAVASPLNHDETNYGVNSTLPRGNATTVTKKCFVGSVACTNSVTNITYDTTGQVVATSVTGPGSTTQTTQYYYTDNYTTDDGSPSGNTNTYVTEILRPSTNGVQHKTSYAYDFDKGGVRTAVDENNQPTYYLYNDPLARLTEVTYPDGGQTNYAYNDQGPEPTQTTTRLIRPGTTESITAMMDAYGHTIRTATAPSSTEVDYVDTVFDGMGKPYTVSNPYLTTGDPTYGFANYTYDALGRTVQQVNADSTVKQWCYEGVANSAVASCPSNLSSKSSGSWTDSYDERSNHTQTVTDSFGDLLAVMEPNGATSAPVNETDYTYDGLGNLLQVDQWGGPSGTTGDRQRVFSYDSLSRLLTSKNPEAGTITYAYVTSAGGLCSGDPSELCYKTDGRNITTTYGYNDALNRLTSKNYSDGKTPWSCYQYDGGGVTNGIGRLASAWTQPASATSCTSGSQGSAPVSGQYLTLRAIQAYDKMGRLWNEQQFTPASVASGKIYAPAYTYDLAGNLETSTDGTTPSSTTPGAKLTFTNMFEGAGRLLTVTSNWSDSTSHPGTLFSTQSGTVTACSNSTSAPYTAFGALTNAAFGVGSAASVYTVNRSFDIRLRPVCEIDTGSRLVP